MKKVARQDFTCGWMFGPNDGRNKFESYKTSSGGPYLIPVIRSSLIAKEPNPFMHSNSSEKEMSK
jgi:hypothetical protein